MVAFVLLHTPFDFSLILFCFVLFPREITTSDLVVSYLMVELSLSAVKLVLLQYGILHPLNQE